MAGSCSRKLPLLITHVCHASCGWWDEVTCEGELPRGGPEQLEVSGARLSSLPEGRESPEVHVTARRSESRAGIWRG